LKFFFDANLSPHFARGVDGLCGSVRDEIEQVVHLTDLFQSDAQDVDWIGELTKTGPWCIVSIDRFKKHHNAEREALRKGGHMVFVLEKQWSGQPFWSKAERLVGWWPQIVAQARLQAGGMLSVPFAHRSGAKFKPIKL
jgi:hypothetical protein